MPPKRQHYVPRFYLDNFATPVEGRPPGFWVYDKEEDEPRWQPPVHTAVQEHFYTITREDGAKDYTVEKMLGEVEHVAAPIIASWASGKVRPTKGEIAEMASFVALLQTRGPRSIAAVREMTIAFAIEQMKELVRQPETLKRYLAEIREEDGSKLSEAEVIDSLTHLEERFRLSVDDRYALAQSLQLTEAVSRQLEPMAWTLCVSDDPPFITGDTPVCSFALFKDGSAIFGAGFGQPQVEVTLPLSPSVCLLMTHRPSQQRIRVSEARVREFNRRTAHIAERFVISTLATKGMSKLVAKARRTLDLPKIDRQEFGALVREGIRRFAPERSSGPGSA